MPIKSTFFPKEALQGQDLPSHVTWSDLKFDSIQIHHSTTMKLEELYNVSSEDFEISEGIVKINRVQVKGYVGLVFSTKILPEMSVHQLIEFNFIQNNKVIEKIEFNVHLFRPNIVIHKVPDQIVVNLTSGAITDKILVRNLGKGTAYIELETIKESELQKKRPEFFERFLHDFFEGIKLSMASLKQSFEGQSGLIERIESFLTTPFKFEKKALDELNNLEKDFQVAIEDDEEFAEALNESLAEVFLRSNEVSNLYQFVLDYVNSIGKEKILIRDPFNVVKLSNKPAKLRVKIRSIDLLKQMCTDIELPEVTVIANKESEIPIFKLFQWGK